MHLSVTAAPVDFALPEERTQQGLLASPPAVARAQMCKWKMVHASPPQGTVVSSTLHTRTGTVVSPTLHTRTGSWKKTAQTEREACKASPDSASVTASPADGGVFDLLQLDDLDCGMIEGPSATCEVVSEAGCFVTPQKTNSRDVFEFSGQCKSVLYHLMHTTSDTHARVLSPLLQPSCQHANLCVRPPPVFPVLAPRNRRR